MTKPLRGVAATLLMAALVWLPAVQAMANSAASPSAAAVRAIWVWRTSALYDTPERLNFVKAATAASLTDAYLFLRASDYTQNEAQLKVLLPALIKAGVRVWGMEGWRGYFSDGSGPAGLYAAADALVAFNGRNSTMKFAGFHSDMEPQDGQGEGQNRFHNDIAQSKLTARQAADRENLLGEWLDIHATLMDKMKAVGLQYGGAVPSWVDDYYGEPVQAVFAGRRKPVIEHLMPLLRQYVIMSYNTNPDKLIDRVTGELTYAALSADLT